MLLVKSTSGMVELRKKDNENNTSFKQKYPLNSVVIAFILH